jgi:hypothetical protein
LLKSKAWVKKYSARQKEKPPTGSAEALTHVNKGYESKKEK